MSVFDYQVNSWDPCDSQTGQILSKTESSVRSHKHAQRKDNMNQFPGARDFKSRNLPVFTSYFTLGYFLLAIPYRPVYNKLLDKWTLKSFRLQQLICVIAIWIPFWIYYLTNIPVVFGSFIRMKQFTAKSYFVLIRNIVNYLKMTLFFWILSCFTGKIENTLNRIPEEETFSLSMNRIVPGRSRETINKKALVYVGCLYFAFISLSIYTYFFILYPGAPVVPFEQLFPKLVTNCRRRFFLWMPTNSTKGLENFTEEDLILGGIEMTLRLANFIVFMMVEAFFMGPFPLTLWVASSTFESFIKSISRRLEISGNTRNDENPEEFYEVRQLILVKYEELKRFSSGMNGIWGVLNLIWTIDNSLRVIFLLNDSISTRFTINVVTIVLTVLFWAVAIIAAAEPYRKMSQFKSWIQTRKIHEKLFPMDHLDLQLLLMEIQSEPVGIGVDGLYKFDYSFAAQLLVVVITLFLVSFEK